MDYANDTIYFSRGADVILWSEADIAKFPHIGDRREIRNFQRFLRLYSHYGFDMLDRPRWRRYLNVTEGEAQALQSRGYIFKPGAEQ